MEKHNEKSYEEVIAEIDGKVKKMAKGLFDEGYAFDLSFPNQSEIVLKIGGREFHFTKKDKYEMKNEKGEIGLVDIEDVIAERIKGFGK